MQDNNIKRDFLSLLKLSKKYTPDSGDYRFAVLGDSATQFLASAIIGCGIAKGFRINVYDSDYDTIELQIMNSDSDMYKFSPDGVLIYMCSEKLYEDFCRFDGKKENFAEYRYREITTLHKRLHEQTHASVLQTLFPEDDDFVFGNFGSSLASSFIYQLKKLNMLLMEWSNNSGFCFLIDTERIVRELSAGSYTDKKLYYSSRLAAAPDGTIMLAENVVSVLMAIKGIQKKCVILDLDNTLWGGVIGDDGIDNIELGELGTGRAYLDFQRWLRQLRCRGILLCVCSKNYEDIAKEPFLNHPEMVLSLDDITLFVANWEDKASNIRNIQQTLNIGMDSIVFIDDNPAERRQVRDMIPELTVPEMPEDISDYCTYLKGLNFFEMVSYSENDSDRTAKYKAEQERIELKTSTEDYNEYLRKLNMKAYCGAFEKKYFSRIAQLTQRSNQFNLRTVRYNVSDIESIASSADWLTRYYTLSDEFGDYGLVGVVILKKTGSSLFVDTLLMSCRVLKRGMEDVIFNDIVETAAENDFSEITAEYILTKKNKMVSTLYDSYGFVADEKGIYHINTADYKMKHGQIEVIR